MEAIRVRAEASGDVVDGFSITEYELHHAILAVETGTLIREASVLIQSGFNSRHGATKVVIDTNPTFSKKSELKFWLRSNEIKKLSNNDTWPTDETHQMWLDFVANISVYEYEAWKYWNIWISIEWTHHKPNPDSFVHLDYSEKDLRVLTEDGKIAGLIANTDLNIYKKGVVVTVIAEPDNIRQKILVKYFGPNDFLKYKMQ